MHIKDAQMYKSIMEYAIEYLSERANEQNVIKYSRYFKEGYNAWGNGGTDVQDVVKHIEQNYPSLTLKQIIELGLLLFKHGKYEMGSVAIVLINNRIKDFDKDTFDGVKKWFDFGVNNWGHSDYLCTKVTPPFLTGKIIDYKAMRQWLLSESRWTRRAVPVTLLCLRKAENAQQLVDFLEPLMLDTERVVHQGLGWFLRELWKIHPEPVEELLYKYRNTAARLIIQYATEKMSKEQKERFRKEKK